jgi:TolB protein
MRICSIVSFLAFVLIVSVNAEKVNLEVYASNLDSISVAILPFKSVGDGRITKDEPWKVLANDLEFSGRFSVFRVQKADTAEMAKNNVPLYVDGEYETFGRQFVRVDCYLRDAKSGGLLASKKYEGDVKHLRPIGHRFADELIRTLFNDKGIFESKMLFVKDEGPKKNIMIMDWDGDNVHALTATTTVNIFPAFVDSSTFLWTSFIRGHPDIYKATISGRGGAIMSSRFVQTSPAYSPITGRVAFASSRDGNMEIYTCDLDGKNIKRLTNARSIQTAPRWSPNGFQIAFTSDRVGQPKIFLMDADGTNVHQLCFEGGYQDSPAWSPKGDRIAYQCLVNGKFEIITVQTDGANAFQVTNCPGNNEYPAWAADGAHIAFSNSRGGSIDLYAVKSDGTHLTRLTTTGNAKMPDWGNW